MVKIRPYSLRQTVKKPRYCPDSDSNSDSEKKTSSSDSNASDVEEVAEIESASESLTFDGSLVDEIVGSIGKQVEEMEDEPKKSRKKLRGQSLVKNSDELNTPASQKTQRRIKVRLNDSSTAEKSNAKPRDIITYLASVQKAHASFKEKLKEGLSKSVAACRPEIQCRWKRSEGIKYSLNKWLNQNSIGFTISSKAAEVEVMLTPTDPNERIIKRGRPRKGEVVRVKEKRIKRPKKKVLIRSTSPEQKPVVNHSTNLDSVPIFQATIFDFQHVPSAHRTETHQVTDYASELKKKVLEDGQIPSGSKLFSEVSKLKKRSHPIQMVFCGGPVSAIRTCPRRTSKDHELVAISTFADEKMLSVSEDPVYIQFWTFPSDLNFKAKLEFILEVPNVFAVLTMCWCPVLVEQSNSRPPTSAKDTSSISKSAPNSSKRRKLTYSSVLPSMNEIQEEDVIGLLAVGTNVGKVLVYCIPKDIEAITKLGGTADGSVPDGDKVGPLVVSAVPAFILEHPTVAIKMLNDENQEVFLKKIQRNKRIKIEAGDSEEIEPKIESFVDMCSFPIISLDWSPFLGGRFIACVSTAGRILVWDVESESKNCPLIIYSADWNSPPFSAAWMSESRVAVSFRNKTLRIFDVRSEICLHENLTPRTVGTLVTSCPSILPGLFCYDTVPINMYNILYTCSGYLTFEDDALERSLVVPTFNSHQIQAMRSAICENTAIVGSVGADGRMVSTLNGKLLPHDSSEDSSFTIARTQLHVVGHRRENIEKKQSANRNAESNEEKILMKPCFSHEDCCTHKWLEIRIGDAAMRDMMTMRRCKTKVPEVCLDRRLESLTNIDYSHLTPGLSIVGGEAGLVFITPCTL